MKITYSIFPKFYKHLNVRQLAALIREVGLDTTNAVIRDGYWVTMKDLAAEMPAFVKAMAAEGLKVAFCTAGLDADQVIADPTPLKVLADSGIAEFRMGYFGRFGKAPIDVRAEMAASRAKLEKMIPLCEKAGIRAVYQVHHGTLFPGATGGWWLADGLPARWFGIELDPGNQAFEGMENWRRSALLLREYLVAMGIKDTALTRDPARAGEPNKGWKRAWATLDEGEVNWHDVVKALKEIDFQGTFVFMPFYDENDPEAMTRKLKREVAYLRKVVAEVG